MPKFIVYAINLSTLVTQKAFSASRKFPTRLKFKDPDWININDHFTKRGGYVV